MPCLAGLMYNSALADHAFITVSSTSVSAHHHRSKWDWLHQKHSVDRKAWDQINSQLLYKCLASPEQCGGCAVTEAGF